MKRFNKIKFLALGFALVAIVLPFVPLRHAKAAVKGNAIVATNPAAYPFETNVCVDDASGATCTALASTLGWPFPTSFTVPTTTNGKPVGRLVINYVSGQCGYAYFGVYLVTPLSENTVNGVTTAHNFFSGITGTETILIQQPTTIYVDPGAPVTLFVKQWSENEGYCFLNINGDLVTG